MKSVIQACFSRFTLTLTRENGQRLGSLRIRLVLLLLLAILATILICSRVYRIATPPAQHDPQQINALLTEQQKLRVSLAHSEAEIALRDSQINGLKLQIHQDIRDRQLMRQRLAMFDDVLAARTVRGVHILHPEAHWRKHEQLIDYQMVLVKGENYPRWALGHMEFSTRLADGRIITLHNPHGRTAIKYEMTTHMFIEGQLVWHEATPPASLSVTLINHAHKKIREADVPVISITSAPDQEPQL